MEALIADASVHLPADDPSLLAHAAGTGHESVVAHMLADPHPEMHAYIVRHGGAAIDAALQCERWRVLQQLMSDARIHWADADGKRRKRAVAAALKHDLGELVAQVLRHPSVSNAEVQQYAAQCMLEAWRQRFAEF